MAEETRNCYKKLKQDLLRALTAKREATEVGWVLRKGA